MLISEDFGSSEHGLMFITQQVHVTSTQRDG